MLQFANKVKFCGVVSKDFGTEEKPFTIREAVLFVPDLGRVKVRIDGKPVMPPDGSEIMLQLSVDQGKYQSLLVLWDEAAKFKLAA